ncbi:membrane bound O-acyl transferase family-domain-containing protein [Coniochaeta sp. 2T2.1]|nr:membrane bound O-acyl transferase family-domain-containing protein [Coniochaeta sp. 2T2.1]
MDNSPSDQGTHFWDIAPHIVLSPLLLLAYYPPPFRHRGLLVLLIVSFAAWRATISPWPPNEGPTQAQRYGLSSAWIHYFPVIERLLLHTPERDFFQVNSKNKAHPPAPPAEYSFEKIRWATEFFASPRGVGWNIGGKKFSHPAATNEGQAVSVTRRAGVVFGCYIAWDAVMFALRRIEVPTGWERDASTLRNIAWLEVLMGVTVFASMTMQYEMAATVAILLCISEPKDWPPLFGSIADCFTVGNVWGKFWHQYLRQPCLGFSHALIRLLRVPRLSKAAYFIHLAVAFLFSALFHTLSLAAVRPAWVPLGELVKDMGTFFLIQALAIVLETLALTYFRITSWRMRSMGYVWVGCWFYATGWWLVKAYLEVGMAGWQPPFELIRWLVQSVTD